MEWGLEPIRARYPLVVRDFNYIEDSHDKIGGGGLLIEIKEFHIFIKANVLVDLGFIGARVTWCNTCLRGARVWEVIDRAMAIANLIMRFPD